ncbi:hypothetical protein [Plasmodium yoelii yoelii]|uniref:Uncharacterized protein n=1 Tax=Plasmodium yoelii yoelii TaxID=73239 RepID=Q7RPK7_PLAYO|nr:hypothetical protein [Plasmodium yoelii yoelii]
MIQIYKNDILYSNASIFSLFKRYIFVSKWNLAPKNVENATAQDYHRFRRLHNKNIIKLNNMRLKKSKRSTVKPIFWDL